MMASWTKDDELRRLERFIEGLPAHSYTGPWLREMLPQIKQDLRSDIYPQVLPPSAAYQQGQQILAVAKADAAEIVRQAEIKAYKMVDDAREVADTIRDDAKLCLESLARRL
jgi:hypothetical protein